MLESAALPRQGFKEPCTPLVTYDQAMSDDGPESPKPRACGSVERMASARTLETPATLYHYTSTAGLLGIVESGSLWATDLAYLNDRREMTHGLELIRNAILATDGGRWTADDAELVLNRLRELPPVMRVMVACFCDGGDLLGQWRGYGRSAGYAIGVDTQALEAVFHGEEFDASPFLPVIYDTEVSTEFAQAAAEALMAAFSTYLEAAKAEPSDDVGGSPHADGRGKALFEFHQKHGATAALAATGLKNPAFAEEQEWRLIRRTYGAPLETPSPVRFRDGPLGLTPFVSLDLRDESGRIPLTELVVSPGENTDLRAAAAELLLAQHGYAPDEIRVRISKVPFRP